MRDIFWIRLLIRMLDFISKDHPLLTTKFSLYKVSQSNLRLLLDLSLKQRLLLRKGWDD